MLACSLVTVSCPPPCLCLTLSLLSLYLPACPDHFHLRWLTVVYRLLYSLYQKHRGGRVRLSSFIILGTSFIKLLLSKPSAASCRILYVAFCMQNIPKHSIVSSPF